MLMDRQLQHIPALVSSVVSSLPRGKQRTAHFLGRQLRPGVFTLADGLKMYLDPSDPFQAEMAFDVYQQELAEEVLALVSSTDVVLTAGTHLGYFMLKLALRTKHVIGFECDPNLVLVANRIWI
jgi:hypothetical protein